MATVFNFLGLLFWIGGLGACTMANGAPHEIEGLISFMIGAVLMSTGAVLNALNRIDDTLKSNAQKAQITTPDLEQQPN